MTRFLVAARRVAAELSGVRGLWVAGLLLALGLLLAAQSGGLHAGGRFAGAARAVYSAPLLLALWALVRLPAAWPAALQVLPLPLATRVLAPAAGALASLALGMVLMGTVAGLWLGRVEGAPLCRARLELPIEGGRTRAGQRLGAHGSFEVVARAGDEVRFTAPAGVRADQIELHLDVFLGGQEGSVELELRLASATMAIPPLRPGPCRLELPLAAPELSGPVVLARRSDLGPLVAVGEAGLRLRLLPDRSHTANAVLAFLSLMPLFLLLALTQALLAHVLGPVVRVVALLLLSAWAMLVPGLTAGLKSQELAEGRWLLDGSWWRGQSLPLGLCAGLAATAVAVEAARSWRRSPR